jgi:hypothetical protein
MTVNYSVCGNCNHSASKHSQTWCGVRGCKCPGFKPKTT